MKLNNDCIRDVLLYIEENVNYKEDRGDIVPDRKSFYDIVNALSSAYSKEDIYYTLTVLREARYIETSGEAMNNTGSITRGFVNRLTWEGHEFLDGVREETIWEVAKEGAEQVKVSSLSMLKEIAFEYAKAKITNPAFIPSLMAHFIK